MNAVFGSWRLLLGGAELTVELTGLALIVGIAFGLVGGMARLSPLAPVRFLGAAYVSVIRGTPVLIQLFFVYYGLPQIGIRPPAFESAVLVLGIYSGSYQTEIVRGAMQSIERSQAEAGRALGLSTLKTAWHIVLPQAFLRMLPPLGNEFVALTKNSALASVITVPELLLTAQFVIARTFQDLPVYCSIGLVYYALTTAVGNGTRLLERRLRVYV